MANLRQRGQAALNRRKLISDGVAVTYTRGATTLTLTAWADTTRANRLASAGVPGATTEWTDRDYLIPVAALTLGEPAIGDRITEPGIGTFEVQPSDNGEPAVRHSDVGQTLWRVHTKPVGS